MRLINAAQLLDLISHTLGSNDLYLILRPDGSGEIWEGVVLGYETLPGSAWESIDQMIPVLQQAYDSLRSITGNGESEE